MSSKRRTILFIFFIVVFLIVTPLLLLYSAGYQFSGGLKILKTGLLVVETKPSDAKIFLNGKKQIGIVGNVFSKGSQLKSPAKIKNIKPGEYNVKLELDGYWTWEKKLTIHPGQTTFIEDVVLFKKTEPVLIKQDRYNSIELINNSKKILALKANSIETINVDDGDFEVASSSLISSSTKFLDISPQEDRVLTEQFIFDAKENGILLEIEKDLGKKTKKVKWVNSNELLLSSQENINLYKINDNQVFNKLSLEEIIDFTYYENNILTLSKNNNNTILKVWENDKEVYRNIGIPGSDLEFQETKHNYLNIYDKSHKILYIVLPFSHLKPIRESIHNVVNYQWVNSSRIIYTTDHELWLFNIEDYQKHLITRISQDIKNIIWHPTDNYIIYSTDKSINSIELDDREKRNINNLLTFDLVKDLRLNRNGKELYFYGEFGKEYGVYKLAIQ